MSLEMKIESLRARGSLTREERDRILQALSGNSPPAASRRMVFFTPVRSFLVGMAVGVGLAYLIWSFVG